MGPSDADERTAPRERWRFDDFAVESLTRTITRAGEPVSLEPQVFDVLVHLLRNRDRVVGKLELLDTVWGDRFVAPATLTSRIRDLRAALNDSGSEQRVIKTAHGRGFQFVAETVEDTAGPARPGPSGKALIGRADELVEIRRSLDEERLVTVVGPGGIGKTHLLRHALADRDAVIVELADVAGETAVVRAVLTAVGGTEQAELEPLDALTGFLGPSSLTVAIDNCEHVIETVRTITAAVLETCPGIRMVATSRRPISLAAERVVRLDSLGDADAVELLVGHAKRHGVELDPTDPRIEQVCARVDRLPLALELAASKTRAFPLDDLLSLLDEGSPILAADAVDAPDHHRSLQAAIQWSVDLLTDAQRSLFARLCVFPGSFTLAGARAVGGDTPTVLANLIELRDVSLIDVDQASGRYRMLESIKAFGGAQPEAHDALAAHTTHTLDVIEAAAAAPASALLAYLATVDDHWPDVRAVVARASASGGTEAIHRVVAATTRYGDQTFSFELLEWSDAAIRLDRENDRRVPNTTLVGAALLSAHAGQFDAGGELLDAVDEPDVPLADLAQLWLTYFTGDLEAADAAVAATRALPLAPLSYERAVGAIGGVFLDVGADRSVHPTNLETLAAMATFDDDALTAGCRLCDALQLDWQIHGDRAIEELSEVEALARHHGLAFLGAGASTARSIVLAISPDVEASVRGLRATMRSYLDTASWQFALADLAAVALTLARNGRAADGAELLAVRRAGGYGGDASAELADEAAAEISSQLTAEQLAAAEARASGSDIRAAIVHAIAALSELVDDADS